MKLEIGHDLYGFSVERKDAFLITLILEEEVSKLYIHLIEYFSVKLTFNGYNISSKI